jgi:predicted dehydrogenase
VTTPPVAAKPTPLRVGVVGGGLVAQAVHLPLLAELADCYRLVGLAEPSRSVRDALAQRYSIPIAQASHQELFDRVELDAVVVCSPTATHAEVVQAALARGLHVLVEKPLCITVADADRIIAGQGDDVVVQVGYMKRFDRVYKRMLEELPPSTGSLRYIDVVTYDPGLADAFPPGGVLRAADIPRDVMNEVAVAEVDQVEEAIGTATPEDVFGFATTFLGALIHDVNLIHGMLDAMGEEYPTTVVTADCWANGRSGAAVARIPNGAQWITSWLELAQAGVFEERINAYFEDTLVELAFAAPYSPLKQAPTTVRWRSGENGGAVLRQYSAPDDSFKRELVHFARAVRGRAAPMNTPTEARKDIEFLTAAFRARHSGSERTPQGTR